MRPRVRRGAQQNRRASSVAADTNRFSGLLNATPARLVPESHRSPAGAPLKGQSRVRLPLGAHWRPFGPPTRRHKGTSAPGRPAGRWRVRYGTGGRQRVCTLWRTRMRSARNPLAIRDRKRRRSFGGTGVAGTRSAVRPAGRPSVGRGPLRTAYRCGLRVPPPHGSPGSRRSRPARPTGPDPCPSAPECAAATGAQRKRRGVNRPSSADWPPPTYRKAPSRPASPA